MKLNKELNCSEEYFTVNIVLIARLLPQGPGGGYPDLHLYLNAFTQHGDQAEAAVIQMPHQQMPHHCEKSPLFTAGSMLARFLPQGRQPPGQSPP